MVSLLLVGIISLAISVVSTGITLGFNVEYGDKVIATIGAAKDLENAKQQAIDAVSGKNAKGVFEAPQLSLTITLNNKLDSAEKLADAIIENTSDVVSAGVLVVNGEEVACLDIENLNTLLEARRTAYYVWDAENEASFTQNVEVKESYYVKDEVNSVEEVTAIVGQLEVKTVSTVTTDKETSYSTRKIKTDTKPLGYYSVTTKGEKGIIRTIAKVESVNGEQTSYEELSSEKVKDSVTEVITVGTGKVTVPNSSNQALSNGFIRPLPAGQFKISSYWGDGRNHKAMDFSAKTGVPIYAVTSGTVTYAGYKSDYGYNVVIDHGNGVQTRYAHASALYVKAGQTVSQGTAIAAVGNTGYSIGSHLHFEVIINGTRVNPAPYIGY